MKSIDEMTYIEMVAEASRVRIEKERTSNKYKSKDLHRYWQRLMKEINDYKKFQESAKK